MKEVWLFVKWQWARVSYSVADKLWFLGAFFLGSGGYDMWAHPDNGVPWQMWAAMGCWILVMLKWIIWDTVNSQWKKYQKEKSEMFNTIKEGK